MGERSLFATMAALLGRVAYEQGRLEAALSWAGRARDTAAADDAISHSVWRGVQARVLAREEDAVQAERLAREAVAIAEVTDCLIVEGDAMLDLADVLGRARRASEARHAARAALALYERKEHAVAADRARAMLGEPTSS